jgi:REP element-mobilizing transposase RayT
VADNSCVVTSAQKQASAARRAENRARGVAREYPRVRARPVIPGQRSKVTRRCLERRMFFAPADEPAKLATFLGYCLACAANEYGIEIHACVVMSNHHHTDVTDPLGNLPAFVQRFHSLVARGINTLRGRTGTFWGGEKPSATNRPTDDETLQDLVYTITNPVKAGLVKWSRLWPGFSTQGWRFGETRIFKRPEKFFDEDGEMPETVSLTLVRPAIFLELDDDALYERLEQEVRRREREHQARFRAKNRRFMGLDKLANDKWNRAPKSYEERFKVAPRVASSCRWLRLAQLQRNREWEREYAVARELLRDGMAAVFPVGTYWLKRFAGVEVAERGPP